MASIVAQTPRFRAGFTYRFLHVASLVWRSRLDYYLCSHRALRSHRDARLLVTLQRTRFFRIHFALYLLGQMLLFS